MGSPGLSRLDARAPAPMTKHSCIWVKVFPYHMGWPFVQSKVMALMASLQILRSAAQHLRAFLPKSSGGGAFSRQTRSEATLAC